MMPLHLIAGLAFCILPFWDGIFIYWVIGIYFAILAIYLVFNFICELESRRDDSFLKYYLWSIPITLIRLSLFIGLIVFWYGTYIFAAISTLENHNSFYYTFCLKLIAGFIGEAFWLLLTVIIWSYIGFKIFTLVEGFYNSFRFPKKQ